MAGRKRKENKLTCDPYNWLQGWPSGHVDDNPDGKNNVHNLEWPEYDSTTHIKQFVPTRSAAARPILQKPGHEIWQGSA